MDKNNFETYEYFPYNETIKNNEAQSAEQIYVVQEDFLVTENIKEDIRTEVNQCAMYLPEQQFFVDIQASPELIISDHSTQSNDENNIFTNNSYLIQSETILPNKEEINEETSEHEPQSCSNSNLENNLNEITITDEQYQVLQQQGWLLLETTDKVLLLDNLGLHNITNNENLIQRLKKEIHCLKLQSRKQVSVTDLGNTKVKENTLNASGDSKKSKAEVSLAINTESDASYVKRTELEFKVIERGDHNIIKIKTNLKNKDFPEKILLGKTKNGKKLFAKFSMPSLTISKIKTSDNVGLQNWQIQNLIRQIFEGKTSQNQSEVNAVEAVFNELLKMATHKQTLIKRNLFVTRVTKNDDTLGSVDERVTLITGRITAKAGRHSFLHMPGMIRDLVAEISDIQGSAENCNNLHVHIISDGKGKESRVSVNISKLQLSNILLDNKKQSKTMFACGVCAKIYSSEMELRDHQETQCAEHDDALTIDTDKISNYNMAYYTTENNGKKYFCLHCDASFNKLTNCQRHIKIHTGQSSSDKKNSGTSDSKKEIIYRCKMCSASYNHPSTLAKHIVTMHVKV